MHFVLEGPVLVNAELKRFSQSLEETEHFRRWEFLGVFLFIR